jgi:ABC-type lipoprotein release transport system permease subunit
MYPIVIPKKRLARVLHAILFLLVVGALSSLYPAYRATRIDVAEAMKFER